MKRYHRSTPCNMNSSSPAARNMVNPPSAEAQRGPPRAEVNPPSRQRLEHAASPDSLASLPSDLLTLVADELIDDTQCLANFAAVCTRTLAAVRVAQRATLSTPQAQVVRLIGRPMPSVSRVQPCGAEGKLDVARGQVGNKRLNLGFLPRASKTPVDKAVDTVDKADASDPQCIVPYLQDIYRHYREAEVRRPACRSTMHVHTLAHAPTRLPRSASTPRRRT